MKLEGIFPPIPTPFDRDESVDVRGLRSNIERWMTTDLAGIVVLGSNGEAPYLDEAESDSVVATAREIVPRERVLIAGTGRESTRAAIAASRRAAALGADAVLVRTPSFFRSQMTADVFVRHYEAVADACPVPVLPYNFTAVTGVDLPVETVARLAAHSNIVGMKESNGDPQKVAALVNAVSPPFSILVGSAATLYASLSVGAAGAIVALACVAPGPCTRLFELVRAGRHEEALALQRRIAPLDRLVTAVYGVGGLKAALELNGFAGGCPRAPLAAPSAAAVQDIRLALEGLRAAESLV